MPTLSKTSVSTLAASAAALVLTMWPLVETRADSDRCVAPAHASVEKARATSDAWTAASMKRTLTRRGLTPVALNMASVELHRGIRGDARSRARSIAFDKATRTVVNGTPGLYVGGASSWSGSGRATTRWQFVVDKKGDVWRMTRDPQFTDREVTVCGCALQACGPYGSGCPACGSTAQVVYGPLPAGAVYRGEMVVSYPARRMTLKYTRTCPPRRCPAPPPSVRR